jgi:uroporphyrinogen-III synthase
MSPSPASSSEQPVPVLLLKTKSSPADAYEELFSKTFSNGDSSSSLSFEPTFVPVLQHQFDDAGVDKLRTLIRQKRIGTNPDCEFGGIIFTSQRAVEAFAHVVREDEAAKGLSLSLQNS